MALLDSAGRRNYKKASFSIEVHSKLPVYGEMETFKMLIFLYIIVNVFLECA